MINQVLRELFEVMFEDKCKNRFVKEDDIIAVGSKYALASIMMGRIYEELYKNNIQVVTIEQEMNIKKYNMLVSYMENINSLVNEFSDFVLCGKAEEKMLFDVLGKLLESLSRLMIILKKLE